MKFTMVLIVTSFVVLLQSARSQLRLPTLVITEENYEDCGEAATCPATAEEVGNLRRMIENVLNTTFAHPCGDGLWNRVAYLNMSDPSQRCPSNWLEYSNNSLGVRACRREPSPGAGSCSGVLFSSSKQQYSKVCGKVIGYQFGTTDAFTDPFSNIRSDVSINGSYVDGVSITHGTMPRNHIWSFASGVTELVLAVSTAPARLAIKVLYNRPTLVMTTFVNLETALVLLQPSIWMINSGMASSVAMKEAVALTKLSHGSVRSFLTPQVMTLKCVFVEMRALKLRGLQLS